MGAFVGWMLRPLRGLAPRRYTYPVRALLAALSTGAVGGLGLAGLLAFAQGLGHDKLYDWSGVYAAVAVPLFLLVFWAAVTFYVGAARRFTSEDDREWWSRASAVSLALTVGWTLLTTIIICVPEWILSMPWLNRHEEGHASGIIGLSTAILGVLSSAWGFWSKRGAAIAQSVEALRTKLGLRLLDLAALVFAVMLLVSTSIASSIGAQYAGLLRSTAVGQLSKAAQDAAIEKQARQACVARTEALPCPSPKYSGAEEDRVPAGKTFLIVERETDSGRLSLAILGFFMLGFLVTAAAGVNAFSLHSMYGNRLIRSFLGASRGPQRKPHWFTGFDPEDNPAMEAIVPKGKRLFHVVNIALNLTEPAGGRLEWQQRKAAPFVVTPRYSGSPALGFVPSRIYGKSASSARDDHARTQLPGKADLPDSAAGPKRGWLTARLPSLSGAPANMIFGEGITLGRAMAISGAAASPNMGYQTSALVAFAMSMFNVRLGWWLPNPKLKFASSWPYEEPRGGVFTTLREATGRTSDDGAFVYLSDGGHFENLGLYEMVRRRCRRIVVVDATHDPNFAYEDLENCIRRVRIDFGASISFANGLPTAESVRRTGKHFALGEIVYKSSRSGDLPSGADVATGRITYIKPSISGDEPEDVLRYATATRRRAGSAFPHDPTWRQDFDEAQFESYRELGLHSVAGVFTDADPWSPTAVAPIHRLPPVPPPSGVGIAAGGKGSNDGKAAGVGLGALAAAALLTGTVAVTGTVALTKDSKVRLEPDSVALTNNQVAFDGGTYELVSKAIRTSELNSAAVDKLTKAIGPSVNLSPDHSSQSDPVQPSVEPLNSATTLIDALNHLSIRIPANGPSPDILVIRAQILQLQQAVIDITKDSATNRDLAPLVRELQVATVALLKATATLEQSNSRAASASASAVDFGPIVMELRKIQSAILSATPRRNVSGLPEGGRP
ncbi:MAG: hypothetical protein ABI645_05385 [Pseudomonadota bacterium]